MLLILRPVEHKNSEHVQETEVSHKIRCKSVIGVKITSNHTQHLNLQGISEKRSQHTFYVVLAQ